MARKVKKSSLGTEAMPSSAIATLHYLLETVISRAYMDSANATTKYTLLPEDFAFAFNNLSSINNGDDYELKVTISAKWQPKGDC